MHTKYTHNTHTMTSLKLKLEPFNGGSEENGKVFLDKFVQLITSLNEDRGSGKELSDKQTLVKFSFNLGGKAADWYSNLDKATKTTWQLVQKAFEERYINGDSAVITYNKLQNRKWKSHEESLDDYLSDIISLGQKSGRDKASLLVNYLQGLPRQYQRYCLMTDNHSLENYYNRSKLYQSTMADTSTQKTVGFENILMLEETKDQVDSLKKDIIAAVTSEFSKLTTQHNKNTQRQSRPRDRQSNRQFNRSNSRDYSNDRSNRSRSNSRGYRGSYQPRYNNRNSRGRRFMSTGRNSQRRRLAVNQCAKCYGYNHWARDCPSNKLNPHSPAFVPSQTQYVPSQTQYMQPQTPTQQPNTASHQTANLN